jgi:hypothetical protein
MIYSAISLCSDQVGASSSNPPLSPKNWLSQSARRRLTQYGVLCGLAALLGCTQGTFVPRATNDLAIAGNVTGGGLPVAQSDIRLYEAGTSTTTLLNTSTGNVTTGSDGSFSLATKISACSSSTDQVYLVAVGGNPGVGSNPNLILMSAIGNCGNLVSGYHIAINEVTTVGSLAALYPYMTNYNNLAGSSIDSAMSLAAFYMNVNTGYAPGSALPAGITASTNSINALANSITACINSTGGTAGQNNLCGKLFTAATPPGTGATAPTNTVQAVIDIFNNPTQNVSTIFGQATGTSSPFEPSLTSAPTTWTPPVTPTPTISGSQTFSSTESVTFADTDSSANIYYTYALSGQAATSPTKYTGTALLFNGGNSGATYTVKAYATDPSLGTSPAASAVYQLSQTGGPGCLAPSTNPNPYGKNSGNNPKPNGVVSAVNCN